MEAVSRSPEETIAMARDLARAKLKAGDVVLLEGELGAGKTQFVKGIAEACGVSTMVHSPTFALMHRYRGEPDLIHIDLYRESAAGALEDLGLDDETECVIVVEWPRGLAADFWPDAPRVRFDHVDEETRRIELP